jgi:hypothetical protein
MKTNHEGEIALVNALINRGWKSDEFDGDCYVAYSQCVGTSGTGMCTILVDIIDGPNKGASTEIMRKIPEIDEVLSYITDDEYYAFFEV